MDLLKGLFKPPMLRGTLFGLLLGLLVSGASLAAWQSYEGTKKQSDLHAIGEIMKIMDAYNSSSRSEDNHRKIERDLKEIKREMDLMQLSSPLRQPC